MVWQRVPGCRACNRKRATTVLGATVSWHNELMATCRAEPLTTGYISHRLAAVHEVLRSIALLTPRSSHSELESDTLSPRYSFQASDERFKSFISITDFHSEEEGFSGNTFHVNKL